MSLAPGALVRRRIRSKRPCGWFPNNEATSLWSGPDLEARDKVGEHTCSGITSANLMSDGDRQYSRQSLGTASAAMSHDDEYLAEYPSAPECPESKRLTADTGASVHEFDKQQNSSVLSHGMDSALIGDTVEHAAGCSSAPTPLESKIPGSSFAQKHGSQQHSAAGAAGPPCGGSLLSLAHGGLPQDFRRSAAPLLEAILTGVNALSAFGSQQPETPEQRHKLLEATMEAVDALADLRWPATAQSAPKRAKITFSASCQLHSKGLPRHASIPSVLRAETSQAATDKSEAPMAEEAHTCQVEDASGGGGGPQDLQLALPLDSSGDHEVVPAGGLTSGCGPQDLQVALPLFPFGGYDVVEDLEDWANRSIKERRKVA